MVSDHKLPVATRKHVKARILKGEKCIVRNYLCHVVPFGQEAISSEFERTTLVCFAQNVVAIKKS